MRTLWGTDQEEEVRSLRPLLPEIVTARVRGYTLALSHSCQQLVTSKAEVTVLFSTMSSVSRGETMAVPSHFTGSQAEGNRVQDQSAWVGVYLLPGSAG